MARYKRPILPRQDSQQSESVRTGAEQSARQLAADPLTGGRIYKDISLTASTTTTIVHNLGYTPTNTMLMHIRCSASISNYPRVDEVTREHVKVINNNGTAITANLWVS